MVYLRRNKYGNKKQKADGYTFDSKAEAARYQELKLLERAGRIEALDVHPVFFVTVKGIQVCKVSLDFRYLQHKITWVYEDVKGKDNALSRLKRKLVEAQYGMKVHVVKA